MAIVTVPKTELLLARHDFSICGIMIPVSRKDKGLYAATLARAR